MAFYLGDGKVLTAILAPLFELKFRCAHNPAALYPIERIDFILLQADL
jgi:hypothetical protein